ncbi:MAG: MarR family transcriptional regulator [Roseibium album]|uniref:MarR family winged helix-turn-helix transcriptional regulator n=1 Tax=Roseibium album TaxID=311410 RepID=UPI0032EFF694
MNIAYPNVSVTMLVVDLARLLRRRFEAALADVETGLTAGEARTLFYVWRHPGQRQAALADIMFVEPMTLVGYLDSLEGSGLIKRCPDPKDKRAKLVELTPESNPLLERIGAALQSVRAKALEDIAEDDRAVLERLLQDMKDNLISEEGIGKRK